MGKHTQTNARGQSVICHAAHDDGRPATFRNRFARADAPLSEARRLVERFGSLFAGFLEPADPTVDPERAYAGPISALEVFRVGPHDPALWKARQSTTDYNHECRCRPGPDGERPTCVGKCGRRPLPRPPARPYPLARMLVMYPAWSPNPQAFRLLEVELPDGRVVPGASMAADPYLARLWFLWDADDPQVRARRDAELARRRAAV